MNYREIESSLDKRSEFMKQVTIKIGDPEKKKGDNFLFFHAYKVTCFQGEKEVWKVYRR